MESINMNEKITRQEHWEKYWKNHEPPVIKKLFFDEYIDLLPKSGRLIEIGGFPGNNVGFLRKKFGLDVAILDYVIIPEIVTKVEKMYDLEPKSITVIEKDFFQFKSDIKYDVVTSFGFIEHFNDTEEVIKNHIDLLKPGGVFFATIPNFRGINGQVQRIFHPENYALHNINSMDINLIKDILGKMSLENILVTYVDRPSIWLEKDIPIGNLIKKILYYFSKILRLSPFKKNVLLGPHIIMYGVKTIKR